LETTTGLTATSDKVYQWLAHGRWFSPIAPASSSTKTGLHDIADLLLKVAFLTISLLIFLFHQSLPFIRIFAQNISILLIGGGGKV
jgi:hypothetical protein